MSDNKETYLKLVQHQEFFRNSEGNETVKCKGIAARLCLGGEVANGYSIDNVIEHFHHINQNSFPELCLIHLMNMFINEKMYYEASRIIEVAKSVIQNQNRMTSYKCIDPSYITRWENKIETFNK
jgi:hypothetical protein